MPAADARFATPNGSRYLQQLCKHFAHRIEVDFSETEGRCALPTGSARLRADAGGFDMQVENHLTRFAFRETPQPRDRQEDTAK